MADLRALLWYRSLEVKSIDDLYAAMKAAGVVKNEREFSVYAGVALNCYADSPSSRGGTRCIYGCWYLSHSDGEHV